MKLTQYTGGFVQTNGYLIETSEGNVLIDAPEGICDWLKSLGVEVGTVLLTHQHYDHVMDANALQLTGARLHAFSDYSTELTLETVARSWGMPIAVTPYQVDEILSMAGPVTFAGVEFQLAHVPGHSTDSITFHLPDHGVVFSGDTLFAGSIGRTDLPGGNTKELLGGIASKLMHLPIETRVLPGHGPETTIQAEKSGNPYLD